jgi:hypothetical protein
MIKHKVLTLLSLVVLLCLGAAPALAQESTLPYTLVGGQAVGAVLAGDAAGSFNYYRVSYPGNSTDVRIQVSVSTYEAVLAHTVGFNVYGPNGRADKGDWKADAGYLEVTYQEEAPAELSVQVFNYGSTPISYSITATGLPQTTTAAAATETTAPAATTSVTPSTTKGEGALLGNTGGAVSLYHVAYAGASTDCTVTMTYQPADPSFARAFGINVYAPDGTLVATGSPTDLFNVIEATFNTDVAGSYTVQVFNYTDGITLYYAMEVAQ